jgi:glutathione reductase (NADPH)
MREWKVYAIAGEPLARAKVIIESGTGRILGAHLLGGGADEIINLFALAMRFGITAPELKTMVFAYPTFASALPYTLS